MDYISSVRSLSERGTRTRSCAAWNEGKQKAVSELNHVQSCHNLCSNVNKGIYLCWAWLKVGIQFSIHRRYVSVYACVIVAMNNFTIDLPSWIAFLTSVISPTRLCFKKCCYNNTGDAIRKINMVRATRSGKFSVELRKRYEIVSCSFRMLPLS